METQNIHTFKDRHLGNNLSARNSMLSAIGFSSTSSLIDATIPSNISIDKKLAVGDALSEEALLQKLHDIADKNTIYKSFIGQGYYNNYTPKVILRNILENPGWYTQYTPYQAEIAQGRLEALLNYQTMITDLTGMEIANASLLDESTAAAEAMMVAARTHSRSKRLKFFVDENIFEQTREVVTTRSEPLGIELVFGDYKKLTLDNSYCGILVQYPNATGGITDFHEITEKCKLHNVVSICIADILALCILKSPKDIGFDIAVGSTQRFGIPFGFGGPHAAYFASSDKFKRQIPGRIIGVSKDAAGAKALRMALQTREQHIRKDKATSNICTAQVLLAVMAGMYATYHGPKALKSIAEKTHYLAKNFKINLDLKGLETNTEEIFDTVQVQLKSEQVVQLRKAAEANQINLYYAGNVVRISMDETTTKEDVLKLYEVFCSVFAWQVQEWRWTEESIPAKLQRKDAILQHPIFNKYHTEHEMLRYIKSLENKDLSLTHSMISLGSCTMKLNATTEMIPVTWPKFGQIHPFAPADQHVGYTEILRDLEADLSDITGFDSISFQPNSGAQGEYTGLMVIREYFKDKGQTHRNIALVPESAHGTNPASAVMAGMKVVVIKCTDTGYIDMDDLTEKTTMHASNLAVLMITYPSTFGVYEENIKDITQLIHDNGGQVYMDGANMNAQVGLTSPGSIGADVCHLNLHKTFCIPHGGGGPGMGPIGVARHLSPFLPKHKFVQTGGKSGIGSIAGAPFGSTSILLISYAYIKMMGSDGLKEASEMAILNANYLKVRLDPHYPILYTGKNNTTAHEFIIDCRGFKQYNIQVEDIAKRMMDYGFHAPTVSFPVAGTMMIEPTESETKEELDRFVECLILIREEIEKVAKNIWPRDNNPLVNAPHTVKTLVKDWNFPYSKQEAVFPANFVIDKKFWPSVSRVDNTYGDRNLICSCLPIDAYEKEMVSD
ncbi:MAG: Glycine dehydrogenase (decarboxylating) [Bacteroidetes bacterium MED-G17]|nr:MAG: Glycine dehydrogenase (decarboxylating) [Bacteroidetes bacterium MED-G17]